MSKNDDYDTPMQEHELNSLYRTIDGLKARVKALEDSIKAFQEHVKGAYDGTCGIECSECELRFRKALAP